MGRAFQVLTLAEIVAINRRMIDLFSGFHAGESNLANPGSLDHVLHEIQGSFFGFEPYPTVVEKAAVLAWRIIANHVFHDGNKRTGIEVCRVSLELNGLVMPIDFEVIKIAVEIASGELTLQDFTAWLQKRVLEIPEDYRPNQ